jgi:hypothetical protein
LKFQAEAFRVEGFQPTRSDGSVYLDGEANDAFRQVAVFEHANLREAPWCSGFSVVGLAKG